MTHKVAALVMVLSLSACSSPDAPDVGARTRLGGENGSEASDSEGKPKEALKKAKKVAEDAVPGQDGAAARAAGQAPGGGSNSAIDPSLATASASVEDPPSDARKEGLTESFTEIVGASITGTGEDFRMVLNMGGTVPDKMPDDRTHWIISFGITGEDDSGYSFGARCTQKGWEAYMGGKDDTAEFPGTFVTQGSDIIMTAPWRAVAGPRRFEWYAASTWFRQLANTSHYAVDLVPNRGTAKFPN